MRNFTFLVSAFLAVVVTVFASNAGKGDDHEDNRHKHRDGCLTTHEAEKLKDLWVSLFEKIYDGGAVARNSLTDDFKLYTESTSTATPNRTVPIDAPYYDSKEAFVKFTSSPPSLEYDVIAWDHGCHTFTVRWRLHFQPTGIAGIDLVFVKKGSYLLEKAYSEWNNALYLAEIGQLCK